MASLRIVPSLRRLVHVVPRLPRAAALAANGIPGLYLAAGFAQAWTDYQTYLTTQLLLRTAGTEYESSKPFYITKAAAQRPEATAVFHYALQAHNNHLFVEQMLPLSEPTHPLKLLVAKVEQQFGSMEVLREQMVAAAAGLVGQGWVFLVEDKTRRLRILQCHNEGSPYIEGRHQEVELNGPVLGAVWEELEATRQQVAGGEREYKLPLIALSAWEHLYLEDYGVAGRARFLAATWDALNWDVVNNRLYSFE